MALRPVAGLIAPVWAAAAAVVLVLSPLLTGLGRAVERISGRPHALALARLARAYFAGELRMLAGGAWLWLRAGRGARLDAPEVRERHYALLRRFLGGLVGPTLGTLRLRVELEGDPAAAAALAGAGRPLLLFSRHAGPGDSVLLLHLLLARYGRHPRIVMKEALALDPALGLVARRLPNALVDPDDDDAAVEQIRRAAAGLDGRGVLLLFPEGGNFTPRRRLRAIRSLLRQGLHLRAERAREMEHMISPRARGAGAAMEAAPGADVILSAHTGFGRAAGVLDVLRGIPVDRTLRVRLWHVAPGERPPAAGEPAEWLDRWWKRMDDWIDEAEGADSAQGAVVQASTAARGRR